ncbi:MAG: cytochrome c [Deltaproteobacteria bacterium]|nr:cytochrome c [Deltaproteobacteria bacterium]
MFPYLFGMEEYGQHCASCYIHGVGYEMFSSGRGGMICRCFPQIAPNLKEFLE